MTDQTYPQQIDLEFCGPTFADDTSGWTFITVPDSVTHFGTRKHVKIEGTVDGHPIAATLMPSGDGAHWLPLKAAVRKTLGIGKAGDSVKVHLQNRLT